MRLDEAVATAKADAQGNWKVVLPAVKADGKTPPHDRQRQEQDRAGRHPHRRRVARLGPVEHGDGDHALRQGGKGEIAAANCPKIRLLLVPKTSSDQPAKDVQASWVACSPKTIVAGGWGGFSAALYYFGRRLHKELDVPVGLIESAWGGSAIEPWTVAGEKAGGMYNGMIAPVKPLAIRGVIWYQGETNVSQRTAWSITAR